MIALVKVDGTQINQNLSGAGFINRIYNPLYIILVSIEVSGLE